MSMIPRIRRVLYRSASILGDVEAVRRGPKATAHRFVRKFVYQTVFSILRGRW